MVNRNTAGAAADVAIRPARPADLGVIVALDAEATGMPKASYWRERLERFGGGQQDRFFLLAEQAGGVIGFIAGEVRAWEFGSPPSGWVFAINVARGQRLRGLGTLLLDAICARFRRAGARQVRTMIAKDDRLVMAFFRSQGMMAGPFIELEKAL